MRFVKRVREWVQARIDAVILPVVKRCVTEAAEPVDYQRLALEVSTLKEFRREVCTGVSADLIGDTQFAEQVAENLDARDIAYHIDAEDVASHVEVDSSDLNIDVDDVAAKINYRDLCRCLLAELKSGV